MDNENFLARRARTLKKCKINIGLNILPRIREIHFFEAMTGKVRSGIPFSRQLRAYLRFFLNLLTYTSWANQVYLNWSS
jgi:hypothetical protein